MAASMRVALAACVVIGLLAGCTDFDKKPEGLTNRIGIISIDVAAPEVSTGTVVLAVTTTLDNLQAESGVLRLELKAFDTETNMLTTNGTAEVGAITKNTSKPVEVRLHVPRSAGYRIEVQVYQDGRIVQQGRVTVLNLEALEPTLYDTGLRIAQIDTEVLDATDGRVRVRCPVYITNESGQASRPLRLQLKAREVSTSILADEQWLDIGAVGRDETSVSELQLSMPDGFNYALEAFIWDGPVIVERGSGKVQFLPTYEEPADARIKVSDPDISVFAANQHASYLGIPGGSSAVGDSGHAPVYYGGDNSSTPPPATTPGLAVPLVAAALAAAALILRRRP
jgi:hypothetical protein